MDETDESVVPAEHAGSCVVTGFHRGPDSLVVLREAVEIASKLHAHLHVVHVIGTEDYPIDPDAAEWESVAQRHVEDLRSYAADVLALTPDLTWSWLCRRGTAGQVLEDVAGAHRADMIVIGTRGDGMSAAVGRVLSGSATHWLWRHGTRPVMVVPARTR